MDFLHYPAQIPKKKNNQQFGWFEIPCAHIEIRQVGVDSFFQAILHAPHIKHQLEVASKEILHCNLICHPRHSIASYVLQSKISHPTVVVEKDPCTSQVLLKDIFGPAGKSLLNAYIHIQYRKMSK